MSLKYFEIYQNMPDAEHIDSGDIPFVRGVIWNLADHLTKASRVLGLRDDLLSLSVVLFSDSIYDDVIITSTDPDILESIFFKIPVEARNMHNKDVVVILGRSIREGVYSAGNGFEISRDELDLVLYDHFGVNHDVFVLDLSLSDEERRFRDA